MVARIHRKVALPRISGLTPPSSGTFQGRFAPFGPPLMSNVRPLDEIRRRAREKPLGLAVLIFAALRNGAPPRIIVARQPRAYDAFFGPRSVTPFRL